MKKVILASVLALSTATVFAQGNQGGFQDPNRPAVHQKAERGSKHGGGFINSAQAVSKVAESNSWKDDQYVVLEGNITEQVGKDDFTFKDDTGSIEVEIDRRAWAGQTVSPTDRVKIYAEVDKSWNKIELEVNRVEKVK
ncbi:YgiW/YdeI family stress tolerance OB fold protein [Conservatibacter flavescens]|uniref:TIGR00156 family protein n=1 Tax=Conservatibacter flavescens TaxID=28161 RepID=A0A2M8S208_9PAST|nr:NirD/YgiW/YdeI family stress tolerance protein [Conservatibacter flavescens]PJG85165.1 TIGR00156 family protein [Conservatibacter flavescens]